jgi:serine phosphatase RsbU (regulator of sigma subunit)
VNREELITRVRNLVTLKQSVIHHNELSIIKHDLEMAHEIHSAVILKEIPDIEGFRLAVRFKSMIELGGDFYDVIDIDEGNAGFFVADVSGHGISSAIICTMLKMSFDYNREKLMSPSELFCSLNQSLFGQMHDNYITGVYAWIDREKKRICHVNAGHWPILIIREGRDEVIAERGTGTPFGWLKEIEYKEVCEELEKGDRIIFYTDGLIEERCPEGEMFGFKNFTNIALKLRDKPVDEFADELLLEVRNWAGKGPDESLYDDITLIVLDYN